METNSDPIRVLHVDDDPDFAEIAAEFIERIDTQITVVSVVSVEAGLEELATSAYDCVVSDFEMPGQSGIEFLETVRETTPDLPFILYTGKGSEAVASEAISAGVTDYLQKEAGTDHYEVLANRIRNAVGARRAEKSAMDRKHRLEQILKTVPACVVRINYDGEFVFANQRAEEVLGLEQDAVSQRTYNDPAWDITDLAGDPIPDEELPFRQVRDSGEPIYGYRHTIEWPDGTRKALRVNGAPLFDNDGNVESTVFALTDITATVDRERKLEQYRMLVETVGDPMYILDAEGRIEMANGAMLAYLGADKDTVLGTNVCEFMESPGFERGREVLRELARDPERQWATFEFTAITSDGERIPAQSNVAVLTDEHGEVTGSVGVTRDISELKAREAELEHERDRVTALFEHATDAIAYTEFVDGTPLIRDVNARFAETFGYDRETLIDRPIDEIVLPADSSVHDEAIALNRRIEAGERIETEVRRQTSEGLRDFRLKSVPLKPGESGRKSFAIYSDTHTRKNFEREIKAERQRVEKLLDTSPIAITILNTDGRITRANGRAEEVLGLTASDITGRTYDDPQWEIVDREGNPLPSDELPFARVLETGEPVYDFEHGIRWPDGSERWLSINAAPLTTDQGVITEVIAALSDITAQREYEESIETKNERLEEFTRIVTHDLRNPLTVAQGRLELISNESNSEHLETIQQAHERMEVLITDLLRLAREGDTAADVQPVDLAGIVDAAWDSVDTKDAKLSVNVKRVIRADESRLQQLFENLLRNSIEHGGPSVTVTIGETDDGFFVADTGSGIAEEHHEAVFDPGYSTVNEGTGFGLSIVKQIIDAHDWEVTLTSSAQDGVRFDVTGVEFVE